MSEHDFDPGMSLVPSGSSELLASERAQHHILGEMVGDVLALAGQAAIKRIDLDALLREGRRLFLSSGEGMTGENINPAIK